MLGTCQHTVHSFFNTSDIPSLVNLEFKSLGNLIKATVITNIIIIIAIIIYYINTNEIPGELSCENMISSHVKITCYFHM